jgi:hypothetical protein
VADINLGTYAVTQLGAMPFYGGQTPTATYSVTLTASTFAVALPGQPMSPPATQVSIQNLSAELVAPLEAGKVTLGTQYEVILREVV